MIRYPSSSVRARLPGHALLISIAIASIACLVLASPADAGIGNPLKKAKEKLQKATDQNVAPEASAGEPVVFDEVVVELTNERIENILATFEKAKKVSVGRPALVEKLNKTNEEHGKLWEKHGNTIMEVQRKRGDIEVCYHDGYHAAQDRRMEEYQAKALTDPAIREKFTRVAMENNAAAAAGDSAAMQRIQATLMGEVLPTHDDSVKVRKECGPLPPRSAAEDRIDALDKDIASLEEQIRTIDGKIAEAQAKQGGLDRLQWGMALERIQMYLALMKSNSGSKSSPRGFSKEELEAMEKHIEKLRAALG